MHKIEILEIILSGKKMEFGSDSLKSVIKYDLEKGEMSSDVFYYTGRYTSYFFGLFKLRDKQQLLESPSNISEWEFKYKLPDDQASRKIRSMGISGAIGFAVAGPIGAAAGAYIANGNDVPITLKNENGIVIKGKASDKLIEDRINKNFYEETQC